MQVVRREGQANQTLPNKLHVCFAKRFVGKDDALLSTDWLFPNAIAIGRHPNTYRDFFFEESGGGSATKDNKYRLVQETKKERENKQPTTNCNRF